MAIGNVGKAIGASFVNGVNNISGRSMARTAIGLGGAAAAGYMMGEHDGMDSPSDGSKRAIVGAAGAGLIASGLGVGGAVSAAGAAVTSAVAGTAVASLGIVNGLGRSMLKAPNKEITFSNLGDVKFSAFGKASMIGGALYEGTTKAINQFERGRMGRSDGMMRKATPLIPQQNNQSSYSNNGGATGDLVFAMYNNR